MSEAIDHEALEQQRLVDMVINKLELKPGDIILVRTEQPVSNVQAQNMKDYLRATGVGNDVIIVWGEMDVRTLDEKAMNNYGWFRGDPAP